MKTFPSNYTAVLKQNNTLAWIVKIEATNTYYYSNRYFTFDSTNIQGLLSRKMQIKESIDIVSSTSAISSVQISIVNNNGAAYLTKLLQSENFINKKVTIYAWADGLSSYSDCPVIFAGKIKKIDFAKDNVMFDVFSTNYTDFVNLATGINNGVTVPVTYADNSNLSSADQYYHTIFGDSDYIDMTPAIRFGIGTGSLNYYMTGGGATTGNLYNYIKDHDFLFLIRNSASGETYNSQDCFLVTGDNIRNRYLWSPDDYSIIYTGADITFSNPPYAYNRIPANAMSIDYEGSRIAEEYAEITFSETLPIINESEYTLAKTEEKTLACDSLSDSATTVYISSVGRVLMSYDAIRINEEEMKVITVSDDSITVVRGLNNTTPVAHDEGTDVYFRTNITYTTFEAEVEASNWTDDLQVGYIEVEYSNGYDTYTEIIYDTSAAIPATDVTGLLINPPNVQDITYTVKVTFRPNEGVQSSETAVGSFSLSMITSSNHIFTDPEDLYFTYADGLSKSYSGGSGTAVYAQEIIRDLLARYTNFDVADAAITVNNTTWSRLATDRTDEFKIYLKEESDLNSLMKQLQYEGRQIWSLYEGSARVIYIHESYASSDFSFTKDNINSFKVGFIDISDVESNVIVNYARNLINDDYWYSTTKTNTNRSDYFGTNEGITTRQIDYKFGVPTNINNYYDAINGEPKIIISFNLINPKYFNIETGDIITIDSEVFDDYYTISTKYFMVTSTLATVDLMKIEAREVG